MEAAARGWVNKARRLPGRHLLEGVRVGRIGIGGGGEQRVGVGMKRVFEQAAGIGLFDQVPGVHHEDAF